MSVPELLADFRKNYRRSSSAMDPEVRKPRHVRGELPPQPSPSRTRRCASFSSTCGRRDAARQSSRRDPPFSATRSIGLRPPFSKTWRTGPHRRHLGPVRRAEFGRTVYSQGTLTKTDYGRDHHPRAFTVWLAGAGVKRGITYGEPDDYGYNIVRDPVSVHDLHATMLHILGVDHEKLTFRHQGRDFRLTDVAGRVVGGLLA
jgi:hypothetical protein